MKCEAQPKASRARRILKMSDREKRNPEGVAGEPSQKNPE
jgi:hypothetical protein